MHTHTYDKIGYQPKHRKEKRRKVKTLKSKLYNQFECPKTKWLEHRRKWNYRLNWEVNSNQRALRFVYLHECVAQAKHKTHIVIIFESAHICIAKNDYGSGVCVTNSISRATNEIENRWKQCSVFVRAMKSIRMFMCAFNGVLFFDVSTCNPPNISIDAKMYSP